MVCLKRYCGGGGWYFVLFWWYCLLPTPTSRLPTLPPSTSTIQLNYFRNLMWPKTCPPYSKSMTPWPETGTPWPETWTPYPRTWTPLNPNDEIYGKGGLKVKFYTVIQKIWPLYWISRTPWPETGTPYPEIWTPYPRTWTPLHPKDGDIIFLPRYLLYEARYENSSFWQLLDIQNLNFEAIFQIWFLNFSGEGCPGSW